MPLPACKVNGKTSVFHNFLGFSAYFAQICLNSPVFMVLSHMPVAESLTFRAPQRLSSARKAPSSGRLSRGNGRIQRVHHRRGQPEMPNQRGRKILLEGHRRGSVAASPTACSGSNPAPDAHRESPWAAGQRVALKLRKGLPHRGLCSSFLNCAWLSSSQCRIAAS